MGSRTEVKMKNAKPKMSKPSSAYVINIKDPIKNKKKRKTEPALRKRAEKKLASSPKKKPASSIDALKLVHELQVHQIELEMQNEELRLANAAVDESRARFSDLYDFAPVGYVTLDEKGIVAEANLTFARLTGQERGLLLRKPFQSFVYSEDKNFFKTYFQRLISSDNKTTFEIRITRKDNSVFDTQVETVGFIEVGKSAQQYFLAILDVSERKRLEDAVRHSEARLESLLKISQYQAKSNQDLLNFALGQAIALTGSKIGYIYRYDETRREFTLDTWSKGVLEECSITERQTVYQLEKTGIWGEAVRQAGPIIVNDFHAPHPLKKGYPEGHSELHNFLTVPVFMDGRIVGVVGVANKETGYDKNDSRQLTLLMDMAWTIMGRKRNEGQLRVSEERFRSLFESMDEGFALCEMIYDDKDGKPVDFRYIEVNPAFAGLTGIPVERATGRTVKELIPGIEPFWIETYGRVVESGRAERIDNPVADLGKHYEVHAWRSAPGRFAAVFSDITDRMEAEKLLRIQSHDLAIANKELEAFSYSVSHDLRNPLNAIGLCLAVINKHPETMGEDSKEAIGHIEKTTHRMSQVITDLLELSRIARQEVHRETTNLSDMVRSFYGELKSSNPHREIDCVIAPDCITNADAGLVRILIENLVRNAWKYTSKAEHAHIEFGMQSENGQTTYFIKDNGVGFDMTDSDKIFKPFVRLHSEKEFRGTGIGLAIVQRIIDKHNGSIRTDAEKDKGATFYFRLE